MLQPDHGIPKRCPSIRQRIVLGGPVQQTVGLPEVKPGKAVLLLTIQDRLKANWPLSCERDHSSSRTSEPYT